MEQMAKTELLVLLENRAKKEPRAKMASKALQVKQEPKVKQVLQDNLEKQVIQARQV